jgi:hypothetical protein
MNTSEDPSGTSTDPAPAAASTRQPTPCRVEVLIRKGVKAMPKGLRINGFDIPGVISVTPTYKVGDMRRVFIELAPTDFIEVDVESEQTPDATGTVPTT